MGSRCTGRCCTIFGVSATPDVIRARAIANASHEDRLVASMLVPVARVFSPRGEVRHMYTCRHLHASGDCGIYPDRPLMCRDFPYGAPCPQGDACEWTSARLGRIDRDMRRRLPLVNNGPPAPYAVPVLSYAACGSPIPSSDGAEPADVLAVIAAAGGTS